VETISISDLPAKTHHWVRATKKQSFIITDRGQQVVIMRPVEPAAKPRPNRPLKNRG
jgi:hypothetical protein